MGKYRDSFMTDKLKMAKDEILFNEGDPGGGVFVIEEGSVEIFREKSGVHLTLTIMEKGEVIGLLTCLTEKPRTASAKAKEPTILREIPFAKLKNALGQLPEWLSIIIKEYNIRLSSMLDMNVDQGLRLDEMSHVLVDARYDARHICGILAHCLQSSVLIIDDVSYILEDDVRQKVSDILDLEEYKVNHILDILSGNGLLKKTLEPDRKRHAFVYQSLEKITDLQGFIRESEYGLNRKMIRFSFKDSHLRTARGLVQYARQKKMPLQKSCTMDCKLLSSDLKNVVGTEFRKEALAPFEAFKLIEVKSNPTNPKNETLSFVPATLGRTLALVLTCQQLIKVDYSQLKVGIAG